MLHAIEHTTPTWLDDSAVKPLSPMSRPQGSSEVLPVTAPQCGSTADEVAGRKRLNGINILELVQAALRAPDPRSALDARFAALQAAQQTKFAALALSEREDFDVLILHESVLKANHAAHRAAIDLLRLMQPETLLTRS